MSSKLLGVLIGTAACAAAKQLHVLLMSWQTSTRTERCPAHLPGSYKANSYLLHRRSAWRRTLPQSAAASPAACAAAGPPETWSRSATAASNTKTAPSARMFHGSAPTTAGLHQVPCSHTAGPGQLPTAACRGHCVLTAAAAADASCYCPNVSCNHSGCCYRLWLWYSVIRGSTNMHI